MQYTKPPTVSVVFNVSKIIPIVIVLALAYVLFTADAYAADIYKCVTPDGKVTYSNSQCPDAKRIESAEKPTLNIDRLTAEQADLAFECMEAVDNVVNRIPGTLLIELTESVKAVLIKEFARFCPALGFKSPLGESTGRFNMARSDLISAALDKRGHEAPSFGRVYRDGQRDPPLFSKTASVSLSTSAESDDWPSLRKGVWQFEVELNGNKGGSEECRNGAGAVRELVSQEDHPDCKRSRFRKSGSQYSFDFQCLVSNSSAADQRWSGRFTLTATGTDKFTAEFLAEKNGGPWIQKIEARRVSDCK